MALVKGLLCDCEIFADLHCIVEPHLEEGMADGGIPLHGDGKGEVGAGGERHLGDTPSLVTCPGPGDPHLAHRQHHREHLGVGVGLPHSGQYAHL